MICPSCEASCQSEATARNQQFALCSLVLLPTLCRAVSQLFQSHRVAVQVAKIAILALCLVFLPPTRILEGTLYPISFSFLWDLLWLRTTRAFQSHSCIYLSAFEHRTVYFLVHKPTLHNVQTTLLLPAFRHRERMKNVEIGFRIGKIFDLLDLQASVFVWSHVCDEDRFAVYINPDRGFRVVGDLWG